MIDSLERPPIDLSSVTDFGVGTINLHGYDESNADSLLNTWSNLSTPLSNTSASSLIRLTLAEAMTNRFLSDASTLSIGTLQALFPFIQRLNGICTIGNVVEQSIDALIGHLGNTLLNSALQQAQSLVNSEVSKVPSPDGPLLQLATNLLFLDIYSATQERGEFVTDRAINNFAIPLGTRLLLEDYYIPLATQSTLNTAISNSFLGYMSGSEGGAFSLSNGTYETSHAQTIQSLSNANSYLQASNWLDLGHTITAHVGAILTITGIGTPLGLALSGVSEVASVGAAGTAGFALYEDFSRLASIPHDLNRSINLIYNPIFSTNYRMFAAQRSYRKIKDIDAMRGSLQVASDDYNSELSKFLAQVTAGNRTAARSIVPDLLSLDSALNSQVKFSSYTLNASFLVADTSISGFDNLYSSANDSILSSMAVRQATYLNVLAYLIDSTSSAYGDSIAQYGQMAIATNNNMVSSVNQTLSTLQSIGVPGFIAPISSRAPASVGASSNFDVTVSFKNFGGTTADNLYAKIFLTSGFKAANDSIFVGELSAGAADSISFVVTAPNADTTGSYAILFISSDASSSSASGPLRSTNATGVGQILPHIPIDYALLQNYPNPFNPSTVIEYAVPVKSNVTIVVYDILGRVVDRLVDEVKHPGTYKVVFDGSNLPSGVYFYRITAGSFSRVRKMMLIR
ncbi:MAG: T9SS type A sorting domain-containing protein [Candidatus Kryptoniota bacterium]